MFTGIEPERFAAMTDWERRLFNNVKKGIYESDMAFKEGRPQDRCLPEMCNAIDAAKTLRRSLRGEDTSFGENKKRFVEFINLSVPADTPRSFKIDLIDARSGKLATYKFSELIYAIRCMVHENENLNADERPDYHILVDWTPGSSEYFGVLENGRMTCNGPAVWRRLREIMETFVFGIEAGIQEGRGGPINLPGSRPLGMIRPEE